MNTPNNSSDESDTEQSIKADECGHCRTYKKQIDDQLMTNWLQAVLLNHQAIQLEKKRDRIFKAINGCTKQYRDIDTRICASLTTNDKIITSIENVNFQCEQTGHCIEDLRTVSDTIVGQLTRLQFQLATLKFTPLLNVGIGLTAYALGWFISKNLFYNY